MSMFANNGRVLRIPPSQSIRPTTGLSKKMPVHLRLNTKKWFAHRQCIYSATRLRLAFSGKIFDTLSVLPQKSWQLPTIVQGGYQRARASSPRPLRIRGKHLDDQKNRKLSSGFRPRPMLTSILEYCTCVNYLPFLASQSAHTHHFHRSLCAPTTNFRETPVLRRIPVANCAHLGRLCEIAQNKSLTLCLHMSQKPTMNSKIRLASDRTPTQRIVFYCISRDSPAPKPATSGIKNRAPAPKPKFKCNRIHPLNRAC